MRNTGEKALLQKTDRVHCEAMKICPRVPTSPIIATQNLLNLHPNIYYQLTPKNKKEKTPCERSRAEKDASASYTAMAYSPCGYPTALNPLEASWTV